LYSCSESETESSNEKEVQENKNDLMLNDTLCDCHSLDIDRERNKLHIAGLKEPYSGWCVLYRRGGKIKEQRQYADGMLNGAFLTYYPNGNLESSIPHLNNRYDGLYLKFGPNGDTTYKRLYKNGAVVD
jgi:antitoxin component YwqK of YwqJK toxin-antitoxin module